MSKFKDRLEEQMRNQNPKMDEMFNKKEEKMNPILALFAFIGMIAYMPIMAIARAFVIGTMWYWYVIPIFDVNPLTLPQAFGLSLFVSLLTISRDHRMLRDYNKKQQILNKEFALGEFWFGVKYSMGYLFMALLLGYIGTLFM